MTPLLVGATVAIYAIILLSVSRISGKRGSNRGFFVGNRESHWSVVALAMISAAMSGVTFISIPGSVATNSFSYLQMVLGFIVGNIIITTILIPIFYRLNVNSLYEYLRIRFGDSSHRCGSLFFFVSKLLSASIRTFVVSTVLQPILFEPLNIPFWVNALLTMLPIWLYTYQGGVKSVIWGDALKSICFVGSIELTIVYIIKELSLSYSEVVDVVSAHPYSRIFFFDEINDKRHFLKQFLAGIFMIIATTGLDQDMMQRVLSCRSQKASQRNMAISIFLQSIVIVLLLSLGVLLYIYAARVNFASVGSSLFPLSDGVSTIQHPDQLFGAIAGSSAMPTLVGILFILGIVSATYTSSGSALTALTTTFTVDILRGVERYDERRLTTIRKCVHIAIALLMTAIVVAIDHFGNDSLINTFYTIASYTYGPILGMFAFGILSKRRVRDRYIPLVAILSPILSWLLDSNSRRWFGGYEFSFELLIINALLTMVGLYIFSLNSQKQDEK